MEKTKPPVPLKHHILAKELQSDHMRISVILVGAGGTGSHMLDGLARLDVTLQQLGHPGLHISVYDQDVVEPHNVGRQRFGFGDLGENKAHALVARINRTYDLDCIASGTRFEPSEHAAGMMGNIIITCVDHNPTRNLIHKRFRQGFGVNALRAVSQQEHSDFLRTHYWMDMGNGKDFGQIVLGAHDLPDAVEVNGVYDENTTKEEPTCSAVESLRMQDLFINQTLATHALDMLWQLLRRGVVFKPVIYVNIAQDRYAVRGTFKPLNHAEPDQGKRAARTGRKVRTRHST